MCVFDLLILLGTKQILKKSPHAELSHSAILEQLFIIVLFTYKSAKSNFWVRVVTIPKLNFLINTSDV